MSSSSGIRKLEQGVHVGLFKNCDANVGLFQEQWHAFSSILTARAGNPLKSIDPFSLTLSTYTLGGGERERGGFEPALPLEDEISAPGTAGPLGPGARDHIAPGWLAVLRPVLVSSRSRVAAPAQVRRARLPALGGRNFPLVPLI